jgi:hypothetical protein
VRQHVGELGVDLLLDTSDRLRARRSFATALVELGSPPGEDLALGVVCHDHALVRLRHPVGGGDQPRINLEYLHFRGPAHEVKRKLTAGATAALRFARIAAVR